MLVIPMWIEIDFHRKNDGWDLVSYRYSPLTKRWWWFDWDHDDCSRAYDIKTDISSPEDLLIVEEQIPKIYGDLVLRRSYHEMDYYWCRIDGNRMNVVHERYFPEDMLPWKESAVVRDTEYTEFYGSSFFYWDRNRSCAIYPGEITPDEYVVSGIVRESKTQKLIWRHVNGKRLKGKTQDGKTLYHNTITQWQFYNVRSSWTGATYPSQGTCYRTLLENEELSEDMTPKEKDRTALSLFLNPLTNGGG